MKTFLLIAVLALAPLAARAQPASELELQVVQDIAKCLLTGLPEDWRIAHVVLELTAPGADGGEARYVVERGSQAETLVAFAPCDTKAPAQALIDARARQPLERRNWKFAHLVLHRDGKFEMKYEY
jgi:hypothetical protein